MDDLQGLTLYLGFAVNAAHSTNNGYDTRTASCIAPSLYELLYKLHISRVYPLTPSRNGGEGVTDRIHW